MHINTGKTPENALTPASLNRQAKILLEQELGGIWITGEVSNASANQNLHIYFSLKDEKASVNCAFFKNANISNIRISNGDMLLVFGQISLYEKTGNYQIIVKRIEKAGTGNLAKAFAELKIKLESLGYFNQQHKKKLPKIINSLAIVASRSSAAITDVLNVIRRRNPLLEIHIYHASVQGENAIGEIIDALHTADIGKHDAILLTRGGGSREDLWTFNDVSIAQTLFNLNTPCVSAIGHERDTSISDLVADISAITPSAAAEMLTPDISEVNYKIQNNLRLLTRQLQNTINNQGQNLDIIYHKLEKFHPLNKLRNEKQDLLYKKERLFLSTSRSIQELKTKLIKNHEVIRHYDFAIGERRNYLRYQSGKLEALIKRCIENNISQFKSLSHNLNNLSPLATLSRGFSITKSTQSDEIIRHYRQVNDGDSIETLLSDGKILSTVNKVSSK